MSYYVNFKKTSWERIHFSEEDLETVKRICEANSAESAFNEIAPLVKSQEDLFDTSEFMEPIENDNQPTIEIWVAGNENLMEIYWDNTPLPE